MGKVVIQHRYARNYRCVVYKEKGRPDDHRIGSPSCKATSDMGGVPVRRPDDNTMDHDMHCTDEC